MGERLLKDKVVLITGAAGGIGSAIASRAAQEGARLLLTDRDEKGLAHVADRIACAADNVQTVAGSLSNPALADDLIQECERKFGALDVVVNNAGTGFLGTVEEHQLERWSKILQINMTMPFLIVQKALPLLRKSSSAAIVNISSVAVTGFKNQVAYNSSKGGILSMTRSMAVDLSEDRIRANAVCPGFVDTNMVAADPEYKTLGEKICSGLPIPRFGKPEEIAAAVVWLASNEASYINGQGIFVDGGWIRS